jgi:hypothetical protein
MRYENEVALALTEGMSWYDAQIDTKHAATLKILAKRKVRFRDKMVTFPTGKFRKEFCIPTFFVPLEDIPLLLASMQHPWDIYTFMECSSIREEYAIWRTVLRSILEARLEVGV